MLQDGRVVFDSMTVHVQEASFVQECNKQYLPALISANASCRAMAEEEHAVSCKSTGCQFLTEKAFHMLVLLQHQGMSTMVAYPVGRTQRGAPLAWKAPGRRRRTKADWQTWS